MECERWRDALSARLDGEQLGVDADLLAAHLAGCADCRAHASALEVLHRGLRMRSADPVPDLTEEILVAAAAERRLSLDLTFVLRWILVGIAALEMGLASPELIGRWHTGSELGTWGTAVAIGFLSVAMKPARAAALLPMLVCAGVLTVVVTTRHLLDGAARISQEWPHGLMLAGVAILVVIWRRELELQPGPVPAVTVDATRNRIKVRRAA
jgi:predicted anti-sigma-YlaC factor YlaD